MYQSLTTDTFYSTKTVLELAEEAVMVAEELEERFGETDANRELFNEILDLHTYLNLHVVEPVQELMHIAEEADVQWQEHCSVPGYNGECARFRQYHKKLLRALKDNLPDHRDKLMSFYNPRRKKFDILTEMASRLDRILKACEEIEQPTDWEE